MTPHPTAVKPRRPYDARRRQEQAARTRNRIIDAAERRFLRDGYTETTVGSIARHAGVAGQTIYKAFGGKPGVVRAIRERALEGEGPVPAEQRSDEVQLRERDGLKIIEAWGTLTTEVAPKVAPILLLLRTATMTDAESAALLEE